MSESRPLRVLIADDDPLVAFSLRAQLTNLGHTVVAEAADGREAISLTRKLHPDLVVMDIKMPDMDGLEASRRIGEDDLCPIVLLSAYSEAELVQEASALSIQAYLVKPVDERDLEPAIELALDRFEQLKRLQRETVYLKTMLDVRSTLKQATNRLVVYHHCSLHEALERVQQEARAKKASLGTVAQAIIDGTPVSYHHDAPV